MERLSGRAGRAYRFAAAAALLAAIAAIWVFAAYQGLSADWLEAALRARPLLAPAIFVILHCLAAAAFVPCSPFTLAAGLLWGPAWGVLVSVLAAFAASCFTFGIARYVLGPERRTRLERSAPGRALAQLSTLGWRGVAFAQLNPIIPASTLGYLFGLSPIPLRTYAWAALIFMLPLQVALVALGATLRGALLTDGTAFAALGLALAAGLLYACGKRIARRLIAGETADGQNG